jgi:hypothetical protein
VYVHACNVGGGFDRDSGDVIGRLTFVLCSVDVVMLYMLYTNTTVDAITVVVANVVVEVVNFCVATWIVSWLHIRQIEWPSWARH